MAKSAPLSNATPRSYIFILIHGKRERKAAGNWRTRKSTRRQKESAYLKFHFKIESVMFFQM